MLASLAIALAQPAFKIEVRNGQPFLVHGSERRVLPVESGSWEWDLAPDQQRGAKMANGTTLKRALRPPSNHEFDDIAQYRGTRKLAQINIESAMQTFVKDPKLKGVWSKWATDNMVGRKLLDELVAPPIKSPKYAIGLVGFRHSANSSNPYMTQILVRFDSQPKLKATVIEDVGFHQTLDHNAYFSVPRIASLGSKLYVLGKTGLQEFTDKGLGPVVEPLEKDEAPLGQVGQIGYAIATSKEAFRIWSPGKPDRTFALPAISEYTELKMDRGSSLVTYGRTVIDASSGKQWQIPADFWKVPPPQEGQVDPTLTWKQRHPLGRKDRRCLRRSQRDPVGGP